MVLAIAQLASAQQWTCRWPIGHPLYPQAWEGLKKSSYNAYIPGDRVTAGSICYWNAWGNLWPFQKIYKGDREPVRDLYPVTPARVMHSQNFYVGANMGTIRDASVSQSFGAFSPANGSDLSYADEDGSWYDCYLFHAEGKSTQDDYHEELTFPYRGVGYGSLNQTQVRMYGSAANPLDVPFARIRWEVRVLTDSFVGSDYVTAYANVTHTGFPAHVVQSQNKILYHWRPPQNDNIYVFNALVFLQNMTYGFVTPQQQVPCQ
jgi:hypothetical protein